MKVKDLKRRLEYLSDEDELVIPLAKPGIGSRPSVSVKSVSGGIAWDSGKVFLSSESPLVIKTESENAFDLSREFLMWLATKPNKRATYEILEARAILDKLGIDYMKYQKFLHQDKF
jgi:hypothetical protein